MGKRLTRLDEKQTLHSGKGIAHDETETDRPARMVFQIHLTTTPKTLSLSMDIRS
jgi:hypothetical protein